MYLSELCVYIIYILYIIVGGVGVYCLFNLFLLVVLKNNLSSCNGCLDPFKLP